MKSGVARKFAVFVYNATADEMQYETSKTTTLINELQGDFVTKLVLQYAPTAADAGSSQFDVTVKKLGSGDTRKASIPIFVQR